MKINPDAVEQLTALRNTIKFQPEEPNNRKPLGYVGFLPEQNRPLANDILNHSIDRILEILRSEPSREMVLQEYKAALEQFEEIASDTEDRERVCDYYDEIREIIGFDSTDDILNDWLF